MSFGAPNEVMRATYALEFKDLGLSAATRADKAFRAGVSQTAVAMRQATDASVRMSSRQSSAWKQTATIVAEQSRRISDAHLQATRRIDSSITQTVKKMRAMGVGYEEIGRYLKAYRADAEQTATAIQRSAQKEIDAIDRTRLAHERLAGMRDRAARSVGLGSSNAIHPLAAAAAAPGRAMGAARGALSGAGGMLVGGLVGYVGVQGIRDAAQSTAQLVKQAEVLSHYTGMSQQQALQFTAVTQALGISTRSLGMTFRTLGQQVNSALTNPTKQSTLAFRELGISHQQVVANAHNMQGMLGLVADRLNKIPPGAERVALASKLLGRNWQAMAPLLMEGSKGMNAQLDSAKALGVEMGGNTTQAMLKLHEASIQLKLAQVGVEVQFTEHILPALIKVAEFGLKLYGVIRTNLGPVFHWLGGEVHDVSKYLNEHKTLLHDVELGVTALVAAYAGLRIISTVTRLVRGVSQDMRSFVDVVKTGGGALFSQKTAEEKLMASNAELAASNVRLAESFDLVSGSAKGAAGAESLASGAGGMGGSLPGGGGGMGRGLGKAAGTAERAAGSEGAMLKAGETAAADASSSGILGSLLGRGITGRIASSVKSLAGRAGLGGVFLGDAGAAAAGAGAGRAAASVAGDVGKSAGILGRFGGLAGGLMGGLGIAGMGLMGAQLGGQLIGGIAGKGAGSAVSAIGSGAAVGAGIGSVIPGVGTLLGGGIGAGLGALNHFGVVSDVGRALGLGPSKQQQDAQKLLADTQQKVTNASRDTLQNLQRRYTAQLREGGLTRKQADQVQQALTTRGLRVAAPALTSTMQAIQSSRYAPGAGQIATATERDLTKLPGQAQRIGAAAMVQFTAGLEATRRLPVGTTDRLIADLESRYGPKLQSLLNRDSASSMKVVSDNIRGSKVLADIQGQVDAIHQKWSLVAPDASVTAGNFVNVIHGDMSALEKIIQTSTGKQHDDAVAAYDALKSAASKRFADMAQTVSDKQAALTKNIAQGSQQAASAAQTNFANLAASVKTAMKDTEISVGQGSAIIYGALNATIKAFGGPTIAKGQLAGVNALASAGPNSISIGQAQKLGLVSQGAAVKTTGATGARVPGAVGPDNWTLVDPAGNPAAMVGGGEILVANRHTEARVDRMLAAFGTSLGREVSGEAMPHSLALGGRVGGINATYAQYALPLPRQFMGLPWSPDQGIDIPAPAHTPEYAVGPGVIVQEGISGFGPWAPILKVTQGPLAGSEFYYGHAGPNFAHTGQHVAAGQAITQVGAGIVGLSTGPHIEFGFWPPRGGAAVASLLRSLESGAGVAGFGGGGGAGGPVPTLNAPKVKGGGLLAAIVRAGLGKETAAANALLSQLGGAPGVGVPNVPLSGPVPHQVFQFMSAAGFNKIAIAGMLGNAMQESSMNPSAPGGGLWQQISNFGSGAPSLSVQMRTMLPQIEGLKGAMNAARSPGEAATIFMQGFERPGIPALGNRIAGANAAYAAGYALGGRIPRAATGAQNLGLGWATTPGGSTRSHKPPSVSEHLNPFTGSYQMMTSAQSTALRDAYVMKYGHPYRAAAHHRGRGRAPQPQHMRLDPFTGRYEMLTAAQEASLKDAYIRKFGHPYHAPPKTRTRRSASTLHQEAAQVAAGNAVGLTSGFDLGYEAAISPGTGAGITTLAQALAAAISGVEASPHGGMALPAYRYALGGRVGARGIRVHAGHAGAHAHTNLGAVHPGTHRTHGTAIRPGHGVHVAPARVGVGGGTRVTATDTFAYDWATDPSASTYTAIVDPSQVYSGGSLGGGEIPVLAGPGDYGAGWHVGAGAGRAIGASVGRVARGGTTSQLSRAMTSLSSSIDSVEKISYARLQSLAAQIQKGISRSKAGSHEAKRLGSALQLVDYQMGKRAGTLVTAAENQASALAGAQTRLQRAMARQNVSSSSGQAASAMQAFAAQSQAVLQSTVSSLQRALAMAKKAKDPTAMADVSSKLTSAMDALDQAVTDQVQASYDVVTNTAAEVVSGAQQGQTRLTTAQTIAGTQGTAGADSAMADYVRQSVVPALSTSLSSLGQKLQAAVAIGDTGMQKTIRDAIDSTSAALAQATSDLRSSIEDAAAARVAGATHTATMADLGEQNLTVEQQLGGYGGTARAAQEMSAYINAKVIPALAGEQAALQGQLTAAQSVGDAALADQIAEAIASKNNDIENAKLDALNAIKDSTAATSQDLQNLSGATGLEYQGQQFTDAIAAGVGA